MDYKKAYLESKANSWSESTLRSEAARLASLPDSLLQKPAELYDYLLKAGYAPYTIKTLFIRAAALCEFIGGKDAQICKQFIRSNSRLFKHAYQPRKVSMTYEQAMEKVSSQLAGRHKDIAIGLLVSGLRISESGAVRSDGTVIGKGAKGRAVINAAKVVRVLPSELSSFRAKLKEVTGLTPHQLRKLAATRAVELGAREAELMHIFGWSSIQTASIYVQAMGVDSIAKKMRGE